MAIARSTSEVFDYVPKADRELPEPEQSVFRLRALAHNVILRIADLSDMADQLELLARAGIAGWKNFKREDGQTVDAVTEDRAVQIGGVKIKQALTVGSWNAIPPQLMQELAQAVLQHNQVSQDDVGN